MQTSVKLTSLTLSVVMVALASVGGLSFISEDAFAADDITYSVKTKNTTAVTLNFSEAMEGKFIAAATDAFTMQLISGNYTTAIDRVFTGFEWDVPTGNNGTTNLLHLIVCDDCSFAVDSIPIVTYVENGRDSIHAAGNAVADRPVVGAVVGHDGIAPTVESIKTISSRTLQLTMSEDVQVNGTSTANIASFFSIGGVVPLPLITSVTNGTLSAVDGADGVKGLLKITLDRDIGFRDTPTLSYSTPSLGMNGQAIGDLNYPVFGLTGPCQAAIGPACSEINSGIYSTQLANFTNTAITMNLINFNQEDAFEYDLVAPILAEATFFLNGDDVTDGNNAINISAEVGDNISVLLKIADNRPVETIPIVGFYTNFQSIPENMNLFYATTHDTMGKFSTTFYEWNVRSDDTDFDVNNTVTWEQGEVTIERPSITNDNKIHLNRAGIVEYLTIPLTFTATEAMQSSEVVVKASDATGNYLYYKLPVTIEVSNGDPLAFGSQGDQKVLGFFDETALFTMITKWATSASNVEELTTILGLPEESLPSWTTNLATWTAEDKISSADMIVAVEYLINE